MANSASNAAGFAAMDDMIRRLRGLPEAFQKAAPELAKALKREADQAVAEGRSIDGKPWVAKKDGGKPLEHAADAIRVYVSGSFIILELSGVEVFHHYGTAKVPQRSILPTQDGMPPRLGKASVAWSVKVFNDQVGHG